MNEVDMLILRLLCLWGAGFAIGKCFAILVYIMMEDKKK